LRAALALIVSALAFVVLAAPAAASSRVAYGVQDDAWLAAGSGDLSSRFAELQRLGTDVYRFTLRWDQVEKRDNVYDWTWSDSVIRGLRAHGIAPVVTIWGTPGWANGGQSPSHAPRSASALGAFAGAAAARYRGQVGYWVIWNEPNEIRWLRPVSARTYTRLLNAPMPPSSGRAPAPRWGVA
jgi:GH35 family endo-1,4-beta-xylanase